MPIGAAIDDGPTKDDGVQSHGHGEELHAHTDMYADVASMTADHLSAESSETQLVDPWLSNAPFADDDYALDDATEFRLGADGLMPAFVIGQRRGPPPLPSALSKEASQLEQLKEQNRVFIAAHVALYDDLVAGDLSNLRSRLEPDAKPMLVPPLAWQKSYAGEMPIGGQLHIRTEFVRTHSHRHKAIIAATPTAAYQRVVSGLDALSATKWNVNERVLRIVQYLWEAQLSGLPYVADARLWCACPRYPTCAVSTPRPRGRPRRSTSSSSSWRWPRSATCTRSASRRASSSTWPTSLPATTSTSRTISTSAAARTPSARTSSTSATTSRAASSALRSRSRSARAASTG